MKVKFDPRTKIIMILLVVVCTAFFPSLAWENVLMLCIGLFGFLNGERKYAICFCLFYFAMYFLWELACLYNITGRGVTLVSVMAWISLVFKLMPCCMISGIAIKTTRINEFLTAMNMAHVPQKITIPMAVLFRYGPTLKEDWGYIKDAMALRGVSPTLGGFLSNPMNTVECLYVPLLITASKTADELSIASVTRGIESPNPRSSITLLEMKTWDYLAILIFALMVVCNVIVGVCQ